MAAQAELIAALNIFAAGIIDAVSFHKTIKILANCQPLAITISQVFAANLGLFLGSVAVYWFAVAPIITYIAGESSNISSNISSSIVYLFYHGFWLLPVCILCYICSTFWYQDISDLAYRHIKGIPKGTPLTKAVSQGMYATIAWASIFTQVQLMTTMAPILESFFVGILRYFVNANDGFLGFLQILCEMMLRSVCLALQFVGYILLTALYGWYAFDPVWISSGVDPDTRFAIIECHWAYFLGFGLPYALLLKLTSFYVGYALFLAVFPFCILLGALSDYSLPHQQQAVRPRRLPIFQSALHWARLVLKFVDSKLKATAAQHGKPKQS